MQRPVWSDMNVKLTSVLLLFAASSFAQTPHPALLVLNKAEATLAIVDPAAMKVIGKVPTGTGPHEVAVSADGKLAFVANYGAQQPGNTGRDCCTQIQVADRRAAGPRAPRDRRQRPAVRLRVQPGLRQLGTGYRVCDRRRSRPARPRLLR